MDTLLETATLPPFFMYFPDTTLTTAFVIVNAPSLKGADSKTEDVAVIPGADTLQK
jgi:hypothetical protein